MTAITVVDAGPLTLVEDSGRPGFAHLGVGASGAFDRGALALANRLVGNPATAAGLEVTLGGLAVRVDAPTWIAVTGAWGEVRVDGAAVEPHTAVRLPAGAELRMGPAVAGIRYCLAVRGGIDVPPLLGSRSRDVLAGLGPGPVRSGDVLSVGTEPTTPVPAVDLVPVGPPPTGEVVLGVRPGPRVGWFSREATRVLLAGPWTVSARSDRTGIRLDGPPLERVEHRELPSEGMLPGAIQVSPDGAPTVLGVDHPVTGGYPVIAVVVDAARDALAQLRPGQPVRFELATGRP